MNKRNKKVSSSVYPSFNIKFRNKRNKKGSYSVYPSFIILDLKLKIKEIKKSHILFIPHWTLNLEIQKIKKNKKPRKIRKIRKFKKPKHSKNRKIRKIRKSEIVLKILSQIVIPKWVIRARKMVKWSSTFNQILTVE